MLCAGYLILDWLTERLPPADEYVHAAARTGPVDFSEECTNESTG